MRWRTEGPGRGEDNRRDDGWPSKPGIPKRIGAEERDAHVLQTLYSMGRELMTLWERSTASKEQLVRRLQEWCRRAEASGIRPLVEFSQGLRCYA